MRSLFFVGDILTSALPLLSPARAFAQWVDDGAAVKISTSPNSIGEENGGIAQLPTANPYQVRVLVKSGTRYVLSNNAQSSSRSLGYTYQKSYTWSGALPDSGDFKVSGSGDLNGNANAGPPGAVANASASGKASVPNGGSIIEVSSSCGIYFGRPAYGSQPSYSKAPSRNINVWAGLYDASVTVAYSIEASASGNCNYGSNSSVSYDASANTSYEIGAIVP